MMAMHAPQAGRVRGALGIAAVTGRESSRPLLTRVSPLPVREVAAALRAACQAHLLEEAGPSAYCFVHDVIREVVEADLGTARRMLLHAEIAVALEQLPGEPDVEALAYHYAQTEAHAQAAHWLERAGDKALLGFANAATLDHYTAAREHLMAGSGAGNVQPSRLDEKLGDLRLLTGDYVQACEDFARALALATDPARRADLTRKVGETWAKRGELGPALAAFDMAEAEGTVAGAELPAGVRVALDMSRAEVCYIHGEPAGAAEARARVHAVLSADGTSELDLRTMARAEQLQGQAALQRHGCAQAEACFRRSLALYERAGDEAGIAAVRQQLGHTLREGGDCAQAEECFQSSLAIRERIGDQPGIAAAWHSLGMLALDHGDLARAEACLRRCLTITDHIGNQQMGAWTWGRLGHVAWSRGDLSQAEDCYQRWLVCSERIGNPEGSGMAWSNLGAVALDRGDCVQAADCSARGLAIFEQIGHQFGLAVARGNLGWLACERGDVPGALRWCRGAHGVTPLEARELGAHVTLIEARAHLRAGHLSPAAALLAQARMQIRRPGFMRVGVRLALLAAELALCQGPAEAAQAAAEEALRQAIEGQVHLDEARARRLLGRCALTRGDAGAALVHLHGALAL
jgi:tetratricopeptide (TPR) repeat protein